MTLKNNTYIITGGAGAIGRVVAMSLIEAGAKIVLADRDEHQAAQVAAALGGAVSLGCDLTDFLSTQAMVEDAVVRCGKVSGVVHVAGGFAFMNVADTTPEDYDNLLDMNLRSTYNISRAILPIFKNQDSGFIAGFSAGPAFDRGVPGMALYSASKAGLAAYLQALALEVKPDKIGVSIIYPMGVVDTPANREVMPEADPTDWIDPVDIGKAVVFAASMAGRGAILELPIYPPV